MYIAQWEKDNHGVLQVDDQGQGNSHLGIWEIDNNAFLYTCRRSPLGYHSLADCLLFTKHFAEDVDKEKAVRFCLVKGGQ